MIDKVLRIEKLFKNFDKNGKVYFKLVLRQVSIEYVTGLNDKYLYLDMEGKAYNLVIFKNHGCVLAYNFLDSSGHLIQDEHRGLAKAIDIYTYVHPIYLSFIIERCVDIYQALIDKSVCEGYWLCGQIIKRQVEPYIIDGSTVKYYTLPMLWDNYALDAKQKEQKIIREFSWKGRTIVDWSDEDLVTDSEESVDNYQDPWRNVTNADAFDNPSDYWNID